MFNTKWYMFAFLLWFGCFALSNTLEYAMVGGSAFQGITENLWGAWAFISMIFVGVGVSAIPVVGKAGQRILTVAAFSTLLYAMRDFFLFMYPTLFPGNWTYLAWIIRIIFLCIFVIPVAMQLLSTSTTHN